MQEAGRERTRREEYTEATRQALLAAGRDAFASEGYQAAGIEAISRAARVTRGAFYHHFEDKKALFDAVVVALQIEAAASIEARAKSQRKVWDRLTEGIEAAVPIMGIGGVATARDAIELMLAGASAVQVGTANFYDPDATVKIAEGISEFLARKGLSGPKDLVGRGRIDEGGGSAGGSG